jgi:hypothetical protein
VTAHQWIAYSIDQPPENSKLISYGSIPVFKKEKILKERTAEQSLLSIDVAKQIGEFTKLRKIMSLRLV